MHTIPNETEAAEVGALVDDLEQGLTRFPLAKALNRVDDWKRKIEETEREDLLPIAAGLGELHQSLVGEGVDGVRIGAILVRLGEQTEEAASNTEPAKTGDTVKDLQNNLKRLGSLLRHAGSALSAGRSPDETEDA